MVEGLCGFLWMGDMETDFLQKIKGDVTFECGCGYVNVYVGNKNYSVDFLLDCSQNTYENYIGSFSKRK